jgi:hypothetical protein
MWAVPLNLEAVSAPAFTALHQKTIVFRFVERPLVNGSEFLVTYLGVCERRPRADQPCAFLRRHSLICMSNSPLITARSVGHRSILN